MSLFSCCRCWKEEKNRSTYKKSHKIVTLGFYVRIIRNCHVQLQFVSILFMLCINKSENTQFIWKAESGDGRKCVTIYGDGEMHTVRFLIKFKVFYMAPRALVSDRFFANATILRHFPKNHSTITPPWNPISYRKSRIYIALCKKTPQIPHLIPVAIIHATSNSPNPNESMRKWLSRIHIITRSIRPTSLIRFQPPVRL